MLNRLRLPEARDLDLDDPATPLVHGRIVRSKPFLRRIYLDWYGEFAAAGCRAPPGLRVEIGSGGGFLKEVIPEVLTSDVQPLPDLDYCFGAEAMPFESETVAAFFMLNALHHLSDPARFLAEVDRCLVPGGLMVCIEPANTWFSRIIYPRFHHEPFDPMAPWDREPGHPLSVSNQALPWIIMVRDPALLQERFGRLEVQRIRCHTPFRYLLSGGLSYRTLVPDWTYGAVRLIEWMLSPCLPLLGLFMTIEVRKVPSEAPRA